MERSRNSRLSALLSFAAVGAAALSPMAAHAQFVLQNGAFGQLQFATYNTVAGGANPFFGANGILQQAGAGYPSLNGINAVGGVNNTSAFLPLPTGAANQAAVGNYGGGATNGLFAVQGNRAGIFTTGFGVTDANFGDGIASEIAMYGNASWVYTGAPGFFVGGAFLTMSATVDPLVRGSYVEAGVDALFTINGGAQRQAFISFGFDGVNTGNAYLGGPLASGINADRSVYQLNALGNGVSFSAASYVAFFLTTGDTLAVQGTLSAFGDPAQLSYAPDTLFNNAQDDTGVTGAPEPGSVALLLSASAPIVGLVVRRKRRAH